MNAFVPQLFKVAKRAAVVGALLGSVSVLAPTTHAAKLYKWVDEQGNVTYSERKPHDRQAETVELRGIQPAAPDAEEQREALREQLEPAPDEDELADARFAQERAQRIQENCERARQNLIALQGEGRIQMHEDGGETYFLDEAGVEAKRRETQAQIEEFCG